MKRFAAPIMALLALAACSRQAQQNAAADASATAAQLNATAAKTIDDVNAATAHGSDVAQDRLANAADRADRAADRIESAANELTNDQ